MLKIDKSSHLITDISYFPTTNCDERPEDCCIDTVIIHCISLPKGAFDNDNVAKLFTNKLDCSSDPSFDSLKNLRVSAHIFIRRNGEIIQFVPFHLRAWHAGRSSHKGRENCNNFSVGIELEGSVDENYEENQYVQLRELIGALKICYPKIMDDNIIGHSEISPDRKKYPGPFFNWEKIRN